MRRQKDMMMQNEMFLLAYERSPIGRTTYTVLQNWQSM